VTQYDDYIANLKKLAGRKSVSRDRSTRS